MEEEYTTISIPRKVKDNFLKLNIDWNIKNPTKRKTKHEFFEMILNLAKEKIKEDMKENIKRGYYDKEKEVVKE